MKKIFAMAAILAAVFSANAQKNETYYGSQEGGFAISFDADPVLRYAGNMFNGCMNNSFTANDVKGLGSESQLFDGINVSGKYFKTDALAIKATLGINSGNSKDFMYNDPEDAEEKTGWNKTSFNKVALGLGFDYHMRPGNRLQPIIGAQAVYALNKTANKVHLEKNVNAGQDEESDAKGTLRTTAVGLIGNFGVEYFISKQVSLGANIQLGLVKSFESEKVDVDPDPNKDSYKILNESDFNFQTGQFGANVSLNFYF